MLLWILRLGLAGLYLFAAVPKLADPWSFARAIHNFRLIPVAWIPLLAEWLPVFEGVVAISLLAGILYRGALLAIAGLSALFAAGIVSAILRGLDIDCGCFGAAAHGRANLGHLALNAASLGFAIILLAARAHMRRTLPRRP